MAIRFVDLSDRVRELMLEEIQQGNCYESPRLSDAGRSGWPALLEEAARQHNDDWLADQLLHRNLINNSETYTVNGVTRTRKVNQSHAALQLAEGEFNRYYIRALCRRAEELGLKTLVVYRGKDVANPRPESQALINRHVPIDTILHALRANDFVSIEGAFGAAVPSGPNSGITCRLPSAGEEQL